MFFQNMTKMLKSKSYRLSVPSKPVEVIRSQIDALLYKKLVLDVKL